MARLKSCPFQTAAMGSYRQAATPRSFNREMAGILLNTIFGTKAGLYCRCARAHLNGELT
jgi:hypothetical protein